jgi:hypothetical protein
MEALALPEDLRNRATDKRPLMSVLSSLHGLAGAATGLTLLALGLAIFGAFVIWRLRKDQRSLEAAERLEAIDMNTIVKRYVPSHLQSNEPAKEFAIVRQDINRKFTRWVVVTTLSGIVALSVGTLSWVLINKNGHSVAAAQLADQGARPVNALEAITGVWGWKYDFLISCAQNPHTISVTADKKRLSMRYAKPIQGISGRASYFAYAIVGVEPNRLTLAVTPDYSQSDNHQALMWYLVFNDQNTYRISRSDWPQWTGDIVRCN